MTTMKLVQTKRMTGFILLINGVSFGRIGQTSGEAWIRRYSHVLPSVSENGTKEWIYTNP
jgi:hypothetical protein